MSVRPDPSRYEALIFDCDGTLAVTAALHHAALTEAIRQLGHEMPEAFYMARTGLSLQHLLDAFAEVCGKRLSRADVSPIEEAAFCRDIAAIVEIAEVTAVVRAYVGKKPLAVASSSGRAMVHATLEHLGIAGCFQAVVAVEDIANPKPAPDAFLLAAAKLGVAPARCLVFEDSDQGLAAAARAGMDAVDVRAAPWAATSPG
jgi:beta-phosphoglucomutase-like phosphatase (HAD superfamily)